VTLEPVAVVLVVDRVDAHLRDLVLDETPKSVMARSAKM